MDVAQLPSLVTNIKPQVVATMIAEDAELLNFGNHIELCDQAVYGGCIWRQGLLHRIFSLGL